MAESTTLISKEGAKSPDNSLTTRFQTITDSLEAFTTIEETTNDGMTALTGVTYAGSEYQVSRRFMRSLESRFKLSRDMFRYFTPEEVLGRVIEKNGREPVKVTVDHKKGEVLSITDLKTQAVPVTTTLDIMTEDSRFETCRYRDGVITGEFRTDDIWSIPHDSSYQQCFQLKVPVDGLVRPHVQIGLRRLVCENGQWSDVASFRSEIAVGDSPAIPLRRILRSYNNEEGFQSIRERLTKAGQTKASLDEVFRLASLVDKRHDATNGSAQRYLNTIYDIAGNPSRYYEITSLKSLPKKKRQMLPVHCSVLDLINFSTEYATHHARTDTTRAPLQGFVGQVISNEFDLEEVYEFDQIGEHRAFHLGVPSSSAN